MREIKFRVWDENNKRYIIQEKENTQVKELFDLFNLLNYSEINHNEQFKLELFSGLKDKNGKDIYEGDIVNYNGILNVIEFENGSFCYNTGEKYNNFIPLYNQYFNWMGNKSLVIEVVGDIHENKNLLG